FSRVVVCPGRFSLNTEAVLEMTPDGPIRDEIRVKLVDIDTSFFETVTRLRAHPLTYILVSQQTIGVVDFPIERVQSCAFHGRAEKQVVEMDGKLSEAVPFVIARPVLA